jgi:preprotein translocase subunit SecG
MIVLLVIHILIAIALVGAILLQKKEGGIGGLGGGGSGGLGGLMSGRSKADGLSKLTGILATFFFVISLALAWHSSHTAAPTEIVPGTTGTTTPATAPVEGTAPATGTTGGTATDGAAPAETAPAQPATPAVPAGD